MRISGEPLKYGIDTTENTRERVEQLLRDAGLALTNLVHLETIDKAWEKTGGPKSAGAPKGGSHDEHEDHGHDH